MACKTNGVLTYYYRIDPSVSDNVKGFWFMDLDGEGFTEHEVTDISQYDTENTSELVWFTVPKHTGEPIWLPPYITDNLGARVLSYNVPIYWRGKFIGVAGIEIDYSTMAGQVESIRLYQNGYAFLGDEKGELFYHPRIDVTQLSPENKPALPAGINTDSTFIRYRYDGVDKQAAWLPLSNGMRLVVTVPESETDGDWQKLIREIILASLIVLLTLSGFTMFYTGRITRSLEDLTRAAEKVNNGDYEFSLDYDGNDEVGRLTTTFKHLTDTVKAHINDLSNRVYVDPLTSVKNKGAFADAVDGLQKEINEGLEKPEFAIGMFDCDNLKLVNDQYGHEKGDDYLKTACQLICRIFQHSPVFRIGGDEFSVILREEDYRNRDDLILRFERERNEVNRKSDNMWEQVNVAMGIAVYDPQTDHSANDVLRRADKIMYQDKRARKEAET
jgi:diguanylate cyclase (GGDEF)-like protein